MYVIFGAAGRVGHASAAALREAGQAVRAVVREVVQDGKSGKSNAQVERLEQLGCEVTVADLRDTASVARAIEGAFAVQMLCPLPRTQGDLGAEMRQMIDASVAALQANPPQRVLGLSDYGAEHASGTGITTLFHYLETQLRGVDAQLIFLRSAEHMHNWARILPAVLTRGMLPSLHLPASKRFPTVAAQDVGRLAAELLLDDRALNVSPRVVSIESVQRVSMLDVARTLGELAQRDVTAREVPREGWAATLENAGLGAAHAQLIMDLYDAHNAGRIDVEANVSERHFGATTLAQALAVIVPVPARQTA
nr:hypothetical protein HUO10_005649 [Paraburkholderia busanensis]